MRFLLIILLGFLYAHTMGPIMFDMWILKACPLLT